MDRFCFFYYLSFFYGSIVKIYIFFVGEFKGLILDIICNCMFYYKLYFIVDNYFFIFIIFFEEFCFLGCFWNLYDIIEYVVICFSLF